MPCNSLKGKTKAPNETKIERAARERALAQQHNVRGKRAERQVLRATPRLRLTIPDYRQTDIAIRRRVRSIKVGVSLENC